MRDNLSKSIIKQLKYLFRKFLSSILSSLTNEFTNTSFVTYCTENTTFGKDFIHWYSRCVICLMGLLSVCWKAFNLKHFKISYTTSLLNYLYGMCTLSMNNITSHIWTNEGGGGGGGHFHPSLEWKCDFCWYQAGWIYVENQSKLFYCLDQKFDFIWII